jgi:hypothetical protein
VPMRAKFLGAYTSASAADTVIAVFDAGLDRQFPTTWDNRILSLKRQKSAGGILLESVDYGVPAIDSSFDSATLAVGRYPASGALMQSQTRYRCRPGADPLDHRQNKLVRIVKSAAYRSGPVQALDVTIVPDSALALSAPFATGSVSAQMSYGGSRTASFDGRFDRAGGKLRGVYTENGIGMPVTYDATTGLFSWGK